MLCSRTTAPRGFGKAALALPARASIKCRAVQGSDQQQVVSAPVEAVAAPVPVPVAGAPLPQETTATYAMPPPAPYYPGMPADAAARQQYYMAAPAAAYYPPPPAPYKEEPASTGAPWWIWLGAGVILGQVLAKVQEYMKNPKTPQQIMMEMAMKQMSGAMGSPPGGAGMPPFGGPGSPFGGAAPGANPFAGAAPGANPFANFAAAAAAGPSTVDTTASPAFAGASSSGASSSERKGEKFASRLNSEGREPRKPEPAPAAAAAGAAAAASSATKPLDVVEPVVKEPSSSGSSSGASSSGRSSFFADVDAEASSRAGGASSSSGSGAAPQDTGVMTDMMESMLRNPEMQKMLYPYLPEPMRNPQSIEWMLSNPEVKKQMEQMFASQNVMSPQMMDMMKGMDFNQDKVNKQFAELGLKPEDVISKVMANPDLAAGFSNPKVQAAIMDISQNPMNIVKYQTDPEIMKVLEKVTEIFQPQMGGQK